MPETVLPDDEPLPDAGFLYDGGALLVTDVTLDVCELPLETLLPELLVLVTPVLLGVVLTTLAPLLVFLTTPVDDSVAVALLRVDELLTLEPPLNELPPDARRSVPV